MRNIIIYLITLVLVVFVLGETASRAIWGLRLYDTSERSLNYRYHSRLGWFPKENIHEVYREGTRPIHIENNSYGFRDAEPDFSKENRIVVLGDSFVWGYDVEASERFTEIIEKKLNNWDVVNLGVGGYGTDQEYLLLQEYFDVFRPKVAILIFTTDNDFIDNSTNYVYEGYYKPHFVLHDNNLQIRGDNPVPQSYHYFAAEFPLLRKSSFISAIVKAVMAYNHPIVNASNDYSVLAVKKIANFVSSRNCKFTVGLTYHNDTFRQILEEQGIEVIPLFDAERYPENGSHWTPLGHQQVAEKFLPILR